MKVDYSKAFIKASKKLTGKLLESLKQTIEEVKAAKDISEITDCIKLTNYKTTYRIRIGSYRVFFTYYVKVENGVIMFEYLVSRGQAYSREMAKKLKDKD